MKTATLSDFKRNIHRYLNDVKSDQDILIVSGPKKMGFVVLTLETFNAMEETAHLLSTQANTERLLQSIAQDKAGNVIVKNFNK